MNKWLGCLLLLLFAVGCSTTQSGQHKTINLDELMALNVSGESRVDVYIDLGGLTTDTTADTTSGDADAQTAITPSASLYGPSSAAAPNAEQLMEIGKYVVEAWRRFNTENPETTTTTTEVVEPTDDPGPPSVPGDNVGDADDGSGVDSLPVGVIASAECDGTMSYRDCDTCESVPQKVCMFDEYASCEDVPVESFLLRFTDPTGNTREIQVPKKCSIAMGSKEEGYIKWRYEHDKEPFKPVGYAPRGFNASKAEIIGKKASADCGSDQASDRPDWNCKQVVKWEGNPYPNHAARVFSRCWWTETSSDAQFLQRKFNFNWEGWKDNEPVLVVFSDGLEVPVTDTKRRHYPGAAGHVKWGIPRYEEGDECKHFPSIAAPKGAAPDQATLYYGR